MAGEALVRHGRRSTGTTWPERHWYGMAGEALAGRGTDVAWPERHWYGMAGEALVWLVTWPERHHGIRLVV